MAPTPRSVLVYLLGVASTPSSLLVPAAAVSCLYFSRARSSCVLAAAGSCLYFSAWPRSVRAGAAQSRAPLCAWPSLPKMDERASAPSTRRSAPLLIRIRTRHITKQSAGFQRGISKRRWPAFTITASTSTSTTSPPASESESEDASEPSRDRERSSSSSSPSATERWKRRSAK